MIDNSSDVVDSILVQDEYLYFYKYLLQLSCPYPQHASKSTKVVGPRCYHKNFILLLIGKLIANTQCSSSSETIYFLLWNFHIELFYILFK